MAAVKLTKNELKKQKDDLKQFERYLPTLQLKKQQLQTVIMQVEAELEQKRKEYSTDLTSGSRYFRRIHCLTMPKGSRTW